MTNDTTHGTGRGWAVTAFALGVLVSVAANVAHSWYPSPEALQAAGVTASEWHPEIGAQLMSAFYPIALLLVVEILSRVAWPRSLGWAAMRFAGAGAVALVAAIVSYGHMSGLLRAYGEDGLTSSIGPLAVDGLMIVAGFALLAIGRTLSAVSEAPVSAGAVSVEAVPAPVPAPVPVEAPKPVPAIAEVRTPAPGPVEEPAASALDAAPGPHLVKAASLFAPEVASGQTPRIRDIREALKCGQPKAQEVQRYLKVLAETCAT